MSDAPADSSASLRSWIALVLAVVALVVPPFVNQAIDRSEAVRAERRAAYATFIGDVERCGGLTATLSFNDSSLQILHGTEVMLENLRNRADGDSSVDDRIELYVSSQRIVVEAQIRRHEADAECDQALAQGAAVIQLLAGDDRVGSLASELRFAIFGLRSVANDTWSDLTVNILDLNREMAADMLGIEAPTSFPSGSVPETSVAMSSVPPTTAPSSSVPPTTQPDRAYVLCGDRADPLDSKLLECTRNYDILYEQFRRAAVSDTQAEPAVWTFAKALLLPALVVTAVMLGRYALRLVGSPSGGAP